jgi:cell division protein FtsI (penicillin-binding protein 3)
MKSPSRIGLVHMALATFSLALLYRSASVQLLQGSRWTTSAQRQQSSEAPIPAPRGDIVDAHGDLLAQSREAVKLEVAPRDVRDRRALRLALTKAGVPAEWVARATDVSRKWVTLPGSYVALDVASIIAMRGVLATPIAERTYAFSQGTRRIVGRVDEKGAPIDGIELALDSLLRGVPGRDDDDARRRGRRFESPTAPRRAPVQGNTVVPHDQPRAAGDRRARARRGRREDGRRGGRRRRRRSGRRARCWRWRASARIRVRPRRRR